MSVQGFMTSNKQHSLSMARLAMINVAAVMSLRGVAMMAETGLTMVFYLLFASFLFLVPVSLVAAELATGWPAEGGVYRWVKEAFGPRWGFVAIWLQWIQNVVWYPTVLAFAASAFAYLLKRPELSESNTYTATFILVVYWSATLITFGGLKVAGKVTAWGVVCGTLIPGGFVILLGVIWCVSGNEIHFLHGDVRFFPDFTQFSNVAFLAGIVLLFAGMEVGAVHVTELKDPRREYPRSVFLAMIIIIVVFSLGSLAVAAVVPAKQISLTAGVMQAFQAELNDYSLSWLLPVFGFLITFGTVGGVMAWISGPSKGLLATARNGEIPPFLAHTNRHGIQTNILLLQGVIVSVLSSLYLVMDNVNNAFFLLSAMTITLYLVVYMLMFLAGIRLRYTQPEVQRAYTIPGGKMGMWIVAGIGLLAVSFAFIVGFFPPAALAFGTPALYVGLVIAGLVLCVGAALVIHACKKPQWIQHTQHQEQESASSNKTDS